VQHGAGRVPRAVRLVSGKTATVQTTIEAEWFDETRDTYMHETKFTDATDLRDLDRLLILELMVFRWTQHLARGEDYDGDMTDDEQLRKNIKEYSDQINKVKESMGLSKRSRDAAANDGNFAQWLEDLNSRAKLFGIMRERQLTVGITMFKEIFGVTETFLRVDDEERKKMGFATAEDIVAWIAKQKKPEFDAVDAHFRANEQRYWIRDQ